MVDTIHLEAIEKVRYKELRKKILNHALKWNNEKKCSCIKNRINNEHIIECKHLVKDRLQKYGDEIKKGWVFVNVICMRRLRELTKE